VLLESPGQAAGEAEKAELSHRAQFQIALGFCATMNIAQPRSAQANSNLMFDFFWALQLWEQFRLWGYACTRVTRCI
jgi:hypothetical protein